MTWLLSRYDDSSCDFNSETLHTRFQVFSKILFYGITDLAFSFEYYKYNFREPMELIINYQDIFFVLPIN